MDIILSRVRPRPSTSTFPSSAPTRAGRSRRAEPEPVPTRARAPHRSTLLYWHWRSQRQRNVIICAFKTFDFLTSICRVRFASHPWKMYLIIYPAKWCVLGCVNSHLRPKGLRTLGSGRSGECSLRNYHSSLCSLKKRSPRRSAWDNGNTVPGEIKRDHLQPGKMIVSECSVL